MCKEIKVAGGHWLELLQDDQEHFGDGKVKHTKELRIPQNFQEDEIFNTGRNSLAEAFRGIIFGCV